MGGIRWEHTCAESGIRTRARQARMHWVQEVPELLLRRLDGRLIPGVAARLSHGGRERLGDKFLSVFALYLLQLLVEFGGAAGLHKVNHREHLELGLDGWWDPKPYMQSTNLPRELLANGQMGLCLPPWSAT